MLVTEPRIIFFDLEVLADMREVRKVFFQLSNYPGLTLKATINSVICAGYKVYGEDRAHCISAWDYQTAWRKDVNDDSRVVKALYEVLKDADAVVTHNGKRFDWKFLQTRLMKWGLPPLGKIRHIDTCAVAKANLMAFNNKLETLSSFLTDEEKMESGGAALWCAVAERDPEAQKKMSDYCMQDVVALEAIFKKLKPFIKNLPNYNLYQLPTLAKLKVPEIVCANCGSTRLRNEGTRTTTTRTYKRYICRDCHTWQHTDTKDMNPRPL